MAVGAFRERIERSLRPPRRDVTPGEIAKIFPNFS
jgi:hypothetical protein